MSALKPSIIERKAADPLPIAIIFGVYHLQFAAKTWRGLIRWHRELLERLENKQNYAIKTNN